MSYAFVAITLVLLLAVVFLMPSITNTNPLINFPIDLQKYNNRVYTIADFICRMNKFNHVSLSSPLDKSQNVFLGAYVISELLGLDNDSIKDFKQARITLYTVQVGVERYNTLVNDWNSLKDLSCSVIINPSQEGLDRFGQQSVSFALKAGYWLLKPRYLDAGIDARDIVLSIVRKPLGLSYEQIETLKGIMPFQTYVVNVDESAYSAAEWVGLYSSRILFGYSNSSQPSIEQIVQQGGSFASNLNINLIK